MTITLRQLRKLGACHDQLVKFEQTFGKEVTLTRELLVKHAGEFDIYWLAGKILTGEKWGAFDEATATARKDYDEATAPAQKAYDEAIAKARKAYYEAIAKARKAYYEAIAPARKAFDEATAMTWKAYDEAIAMAFWEAIE